METIVDPTVHDHGPAIFADGTQTALVKADAEGLFDEPTTRLAQIAEIPRRPKPSKSAPDPSLPRTHRAEDNPGPGG